MITVLPVKASRYWEVMRGVEMCSAIFFTSLSLLSSLRERITCCGMRDWERADVDADLEARTDMLRLDLVWMSARVVENQG